MRMMNDNNSKWIVRRLDGRDTLFVRWKGRQIRMARLDATDDGKFLITALQKTRAVYFRDMDKKG